LNTGDTADHIHVRFRNKLPAFHIAPVKSFFLFSSTEVVGVDAILVHHFRQDVLAEVVIRGGIFRILEQYRNQNIRIEQITPIETEPSPDCKASESFVSSAFVESRDPAVGVDLDQPNRAQSSGGSTTSPA